MSTRALHVVKKQRNLLLILFLCMPAAEREKEPLGKRAWALQAVGLGLLIPLQEGSFCSDHIRYMKVSLCHHLNSFLTLFPYTLTVPRVFLLSK